MPSKKSSWEVGVSAMDMLILVTLLIPLVLEHGYADVNITLVVTTVIDVVMVSSRKSGIRQEKDSNLFVNHAIAMATRNRVFMKKKLTTTTSVWTSMETMKVVENA